MGKVVRRGKHWCIRLNLPAGPDGKIPQRRISCRGLTKREAEARLAELTAQVNGGQYIEPARLDLAAYLDQWVTECAVHQLSPNTLETDTTFIRTQIVPRLGHIQLGRLNPLAVQDWVNTIAKEGKRDGGPLAPKTVRNVHNVLRAALKQAVAWQLIARNPADGIALPRNDRPRKRAATPAEVSILLHRIQRSRYRLPTLVALFTGMRRSEVCGLRWEDMFEVAIAGQEFQAFRVRRAIAVTTALGAFVKETKTIAGERAVLIPHSLAAELREHRKRTMVEASESADPDMDRGWLFHAKVGGGPLNPVLFGKEFIRLARAVDLPLGLHAFRHTNATELHSEGIDRLTAARRLGHSPEVMESIYTHVDVRMQRAAAEAMDSFYQQALSLMEKQSPGGAG
jgi:integrase